MPSPFADLEQFDGSGAGMILAAQLRQTMSRDVAAHSHEQGQLVGSLEGLLLVEAADARFVIPATHAIWLPPHCSHEARSPGAFAGWSIYIAERFCHDLPVVPVTLRVSPLLQAAAMKAAGWGRPSSSDADHRLAAVILDEISTAPSEPLGLPFPRNPRAVRVADGIMADLADRRGLDEWAAHVALSPRTLSRRFAVETGFSVVEWRARAKILAAVERLSQGQSVTEVSFSLGYNNVSAFIAAYTKAIGISPGRHFRQTQDGTIKSA